MSTRRASSIVAMAVLATIAVDATAQFPGGQTGGPRRGGGPTSAPRPESRDERASVPPDTPASLTSRVQVALDRLADDLRIGAAQQAAWDDYAARVVRLADDVARERFAVREPSPPTGSAIEQLDSVARRAHERVSELDAVVAAGRALYATLPTDRQAVADRELARVVRALASGAPTPAPPGERRGEPATTQ